MSWKATAFVKELRENLTVTDKFVLLMLAEYHRTDDKLAWPSAATLADDCLMEERSVRRILARLEENGFLLRKPGGGRGNVTGYQFIGLDVKGDCKTVITETLTQETVLQTVTPQSQNSDPPAQKQCPTSTRNKERTGLNGFERVEPADDLTNQVETIFHLHPKNLHRSTVPRDQQEAIAEAIVRDGYELVWMGTKNLAAAVERWAASERVFIPNPMKFFTGQDYLLTPEVWERANGRESKPSASAERSERSKRNILNGLLQNARHTDALDDAKQQK